MLPFCILYTSVMVVRNDCVAAWSLRFLCVALSRALFYFIIYIFKEVFMDKKDIKKSYNPRAFEESDASLKLIQKILRIVMILECVVAVILGFAFLAASQGVFGWLLLFAVPALFIFLYFVSMFTLWTIYDIKMIRNALYDAEPSASLKNFENK